MENKNILNKFSNLEKSLLDLKNTVTKEVSDMENVLNKEMRLRSFGRVILSNLYLKLSPVPEPTKYSYKIYLGGFNNSNEARSFVSSCFRLHNDYSSALVYNIKSTNPYALKEELCNLKECLLSLLDKIYLLDFPIHEENQNIAKCNKDIYNGLMDYISMLGFNKTYKGKKSNRHKRVETLEYNFVSELKSQVQSYWAEDTILKLKNKLINDFDGICTVLIDKFNDEIEKDLTLAQSNYYNGETVINEKVSNILIDELAKLNINDLNNIPYRNGVIDILKIKEKIFSIDKLLEVGYLLEINRNKLDCGNFYASKSFDILKGLVRYKNNGNSNDFISSLCLELETTLNDYDGDGRVFRDMKYNYNKIYSYIAEKNNYNSIALCNVLNRLIEIELKLGFI